MDIKKWKQTANITKSRTMLGKVLQRSLNKIPRAA